MQSKCYVTLWAGAHYSKLSSPRCIMPSKLSSKLSFGGTYAYYWRNIFSLSHDLTRSGEQKVGNPHGKSPTILPSLVTISIAVVRYILSALRAWFHMLSLISVITKDMAWKHTACHINKSNLGHTGLKQQ